MAGTDATWKRDPGFNPSCCHFAIYYFHNKILQVLSRELDGEKISIIFYTWVLKSYFGGHKSDFDENCFKYKTESDCGGFIAQVIAAFVSKPDPGQDSFFSPSPLKLS